MYLTNNQILSILYYINQFRSNELTYKNQITYNTTTIKANYMGKYCCSNENIKLIKLIIEIWKSQNHDNFLKLIDPNFIFCNFNFINNKKNNKDQIQIEINLF